MTFTCAGIFKRITQKLLCKISQKGHGPELVTSKITSQIYPILKYEKTFLFDWKTFFVCLSLPIRFRSYFDQSYHDIYLFLRSSSAKGEREAKKLSPKQLTEKCFCQQIKATEKRCKQYVTNMFHSYFSIILCWYMETGLFVMVVIRGEAVAYIMCTRKKTKN